MIKTENETTAKINPSIKAEIKYEELETNPIIKDSSDFYEEGLNQKDIYICSFDNCGKKFKYKWILDRHMNSHFCFKLFKCEYVGCDKAYKSKENLNLHIKNIHLKVKPYQCSFCSSRFSHRNGIYINIIIFKKYLMLIFKFR